MITIETFLNINKTKEIKNVYRKKKPGEYQNDFRKGKLTVDELETLENGNTRETNKTYLKRTLEVSKSAILSQEDREMDNQQRYLI